MADNMIHNVNRNNLDEFIGLDTYAVKVVNSTTLEAQVGNYGPDSVLALEDGQLDYLGSWEAISGFSGQDRYNGPIFHESEYIGGGLADYILDQIGETFIAVPVMCYNDEFDEYDECGWALLKKKH